MIKSKMSSFEKAMKFTAISAFLKAVVIAEEQSALDSANVLDENL